MKFLHHGFIDDLMEVLNILDIMNRNTLTVVLNFSIRRERMESSRTEIGTTERNWNEL
jgi:hypothetical protein